MSTTTVQTPSPFVQQGASLPREKFARPEVTADGSARAFVPLQKLETLWLNTGTLCNLACTTCYIESSPTNDALVYLTAEEASRFYREIEEQGLGTRQIGFTGGEPFMNKHFLEMLTEALERGFSALVLTNAMRPMRRFEQQLLALPQGHRDRLLLRVSLDHHTKEAHEAERGEGSWQKAADGLRWLDENGFRVAVAGRQLPGQTMEEARAGYEQLLRLLGIDIDLADPERLVVFPGMDEHLDTPEITEACWDIVGLPKSTVMCSSSRMVVRRKGEPEARIVACTLLPYEEGFDLGATLAEASQDVRLNHPHCSRFCVLGGASCST
jgi:uncharacterized Fe-S cluster-containing radical SAM superfamily protein